MFKSIALATGVRSSCPRHGRQKGGRGLDFEIFSGKRLFL